MHDVVTRGARSFRCATALFVSALLVTPFAQAAAPTISGSPVTTTLAGKAYCFQPTAKDADGNKLTFSIAARPLWASFSTSTGRLSGTPKAEHVRAWSNIVISVTDGRTKRALPAFAILVRPATTSTVNAAPKISGSPAKSVLAGAAYSFQPSASDANNDKLTFSVTNKPAWASFNTATGKLSGTPAVAYVGITSNIVIKVSDGKASAALSAFSLAVTESGSSAVTTGAVTLSWQPPTQNVDGTTLTNLAGYRIHYGRSLTDMSQTLKISNPGIARYMVEGLSSGKWFLAVRAYTSAGIESELSDIVLATVN